MLRALLLLLLLNACVPWRQVPLLAPQGLGQSLQVSQLVTVQQPAGDLRFSVVWSRHQQRFNLAGLSLAGQLLFRLQQNGDAVAVETFMPAIEERQVRELAQQIQWAYWPESAVRSALPAGWQLACDSQTQQRRFYRQGRLRLTFSYETDQPIASLRLLRPQGPALSVQTLSVQALDGAMQTDKPVNVFAREEFATP